MVYVLQTAIVHGSNTGMQIDMYMNCNAIITATVLHSRTEWDKGLVLYCTA